MNSCFILFSELMSVRTKLPYQPHFPHSSSQYFCINPSFQDCEKSENRLEKEYVSIYLVMGTKADPL